MRKKILKIIQMSVLLFASIGISGQTVVDDLILAVPNFDLDPWATQYQSLDSHHYIHTTSWKNKLITFNNQAFEGMSSDSIVEYKRQDLYIFKFDDNFNITNSLVIDNVEEQFHKLTRFSGGHAHLFHFENEFTEDSLAAILIPPNIKIPRNNNLDASMLMISDLDLNYVKHMFPTTGKITQIVGDGTSLYMNINIKRNEDFILLNQDTVFNFYAPFGRENHVVLAKYDIITESFEWWFRPIGNFINMYSEELKVDSEGNCHQLLLTDGQIYLPNGDTTNYGQYIAPVVLKFKPDGEIIWHADFGESESPYLVRMSLDSDNNIYIDGSYEGTKLTVRDTILYAQPVDGEPYNSSGVMIKLSNTGNFEWAKQLEGKVYSSGITHAVSDEDGNIYTHGTFYKESITLNGILYEDIDESKNYNEFVLKMDPNTGKILGHVFMQGDVRIRNIAFQNDKLFVQFELRDAVQLLNKTYSNEGKREVIVASIEDIANDIYTLNQLSADLNVFPNPVMAGDELTIRGQGFENIGGDYFLINTEGLIVQGGKWFKESSNFKISTIGLCPGIYHLHLRSKDEFKNIKLVII